MGVEYIVVDSTFKFQIRIIANDADHAKRVMRDRGYRNEAGYYLYVLVGGRE